MNKTPGSVRVGAAVQADVGDDVGWVPVAGAKPVFASFVPLKCRVGACCCRAGLGSAGGTPFLPAGRVVDFRVSTAQRVAQTSGWQVTPLAGSVSSTSCRGVPPGGVIGCIWCCLRLLRHSCFSLCNLAVEIPDNQKQSFLLRCRLVP